MKRIGIDARLLYQTGVGTYLQNLLLHLAHYRNPAIQFIVYVRPQDVHKVAQISPHFIIRSSPYVWHSFAEQTLYCIQLMKDHLDLMHFTYFGHPVLYPGPFIATIHDITPLLFATGKSSTKSSLLYTVKHLFFRWVLWNQVKRSIHIIVPTLTVGEQLVDLYGPTIAQKISAVYEGVGSALVHAQDSSLDITYPFFLYVGNFYPHKNVERLIQAFRNVSTNAKLVCAGPHDFFQQKLSQQITDDKVVFLSALTPNDLKYLYTHALALIHPSLSEGFGLPLVEAAYFKLPIIASDIPVFRELLGESYYAFNPYSVHSIQQAIETYIHSPSHTVAPLRADFSFAEMTRRTITLYEQYA